MFFAEKYFDMNKKQCRDALDLYKKFLIRMDRVAEFLKVAEVSLYRATVYLLHFALVKLLKIINVNQMLVVNSCTTFIKGIVYHLTFVFCI
jgi:hypothetical protein